ncbi:MAG: hypothetical protein A2Y17_05750 [Clostridiales bacterium GWF2_38_85]|nr:MAG: hypothetical protein A2Y17_05750 [Clostridiales bacterium GWF2_38_85]HBL84014.1 hypothetical protein [Clostridiales bacterium]
MYMKLIDVGFGNSVSADRIVAIVTTDSLPIRRMIQDAKDTGRAIDVTCGKKTLAVLITDSDHLILSADDVESIKSKLTDN